MAATETSLVGSASNEYPSTHRPNTGSAEEMLPHSETSILRTCSRIQQASQEEALNFCTCGDQGDIKEEEKRRGAMRCRPPMGAA
jgi:hypothetical protein